MKKLAGKISIITGASQGIGRGIARAFAREGSDLILTARDTNRLMAAAGECREYGVTVVEVAGNVADEKHVEEVFATLTTKFGRLDLLVNNAGAFDGGPLDELSTAAWDHVIATNLRGPFLFTRQALRIMKPQRAGRILNMGSISAQRVRPRSAPYSASKHGLWGLTQVTALEGREYGVTCGCLHPGNIRTERRTASGKTEDDEPMLEIDELAEVAVLMASLPPHVEMLESIVLPRDQLYVGRG